MQVYTVILETRRQRRVKIAAGSAEQARDNAQVLLQAGDRIIAVQAPVGDLPDGREALAHLVSRDYLDHDGQAQEVRDWLLRALQPGQIEPVNKRLALAGLRVMPDGGVAIASASVIPTLNGWFKGTPWAADELRRTLSRLPGAGDGGMSFGGRLARCIIVPLDLILPEPMRVAAE